MRGRARVEQSSREAWVSQRRWTIDTTDGYAVDNPEAR
jgi:hypothetical protein